MKNNNRRFVAFAIAFICAIMQIFISIGISSFAVSDDKENGLSKST
jgi:hypothetical protein